MHRLRILLAILVATSVAAAQAQTTTWLNATSGTATISTNYATTDGLTLNMGFYADYLVVGGGGGLGNVTNMYPGGGGGGQVLTGSNVQLTTQSYGVSVGSGGGAADGGTSSVFGFTAAGGVRSSSSAPNGGASGSGNAGGTGPYDAGGGGGQNAVGGNGTSNPRGAGNGGAGLTSSFTGSSAMYGFGGSGGATPVAVVATNGDGTSTNPRANSGGGGRASSGGVTTSGTGAAGIVVIRYSGSSVGAIGGTVTTGTGAAAGYTLHTFTTTGSSTFTLGAVNLNARLGATLTGTISGASGDFTYNGPGTLTLAADNTYAGATIISGGTLRVGNGGATGSLGSGTVHNNTALVFNRSDAITVANAISGTGSLQQRGSGSITLSASNSFSGSTRSMAGTLSLGHVDALSRSTLDLDAADTGSVGFTVAGSNTYRLGGLSGSRSLANAGNSLSIGGGNASNTYAGALSGTGGLEKTGTASFTLSGANTYTGPTTVSGGVLKVNGNSTAATGAVTVASGGSLGGSGTVGGVIAFQRGSTLAPGNSPGTFTTAGDVAWASGANYNWQLINATGTAGTVGGWDLMSVGGVLDVQATSGDRFNLNLWTLSSTGPDVDGSAANFDTTIGQTWKIASAAGGIQNFSADKFTINTAATNGTGGFANNVAGGVFSVATAGNDLNLEFTPGGQQYLDAAAAAVVTSQRYTTDNGLTINLALPVDMLVVGGGGGVGGANGTYLAGGGGGQVLTGTAIQVTAASNAIAVGSGGGASAGTAAGSSGQSSAALGITAAGGTGGGATGAAIGGASGSGSDGGAASSGPGGGLAGGGGGGQLTSGSTGVYNATGPVRVGGQGGIGLMSSLTGTSQMYGFGGGGQAPTVNAQSGPGLNGDGTSGAPRANSGGGGWSNTAGAAGVVVVRYAGAQAASGGAVTTVGGDTVHTFTSSGSFALGNVRATLSGTIAGSGNFTFAGPGTLALTAANTYTGSTIISSGTLQVGDGGSTGSLPATGITNNATLAFNRDDAITVSSVISGSGAVVHLGTGTTTLTGSNSYTGGTVVSAGRLVGTTASLQGGITNNAAVEFAQASDGTYVGVISGSGGLVKSDAGRVTLSGANTFAGATTVSGGTLATSAAGRLPSGNAVAITTGATLELGGSQTLAVVAGSGVLDLAVGTLTVGATTGEFAGSITGTGNLVKSGVGVFTLSGSSTFSGDVTVSGGTLVLDNNAALNAANDVSLTSGATLTVNAGRTVRVNSFTLTEGTLSGAGALEALTTTVNSATIDTPIEDAPGQSSNFVKTGTGTTTVNAANTFTGTVDVLAGTVQLGSGGSFSPSSSLQLASGATLDLAGQSQTFAAVSGTGGTIALGAGTLSVNAAAANTFGGGITGSGGVVKQGTGNLILSGSSNYSGATSVTGGRLSVNGSLANSAVAVLAAAELGGSGTIAGPVSIDAGGTLSPGNSIQSLATGTATFASGATFEYEVDSTDLNSLATAADLLVVSGDLNLDLSNGTLLTFLDLASTPQPFVEDTTIFVMINYSGTWNGGLFTYGANVLSDGERFMAGTQLWEIDYNRTDATGLANFTGDYVGSNFVTVTAVPEPSTLVLIGLGLGGLLLARRRAPRKNSLSYRNIPIQ